MFMMQFLIVTYFMAFAHQPLPLLCSYCSICTRAYSVSSPTNKAMLTQVVKSVSDFLAQGFHKFV
jgi:hypothetical protein